MKRFFETIFNLLTKKERLIFVSAILVFILTGSLLFIYYVGKITSIKPEYGGSISEGVVGQPSFINPVLAKPDSVDMDLSVLMFASMKDIASHIEHNKDYTKWTVRIKDGALWSDESPITSDDIIFTIRTIQNPDVLSPLYSDFENVEASRISLKEIEFTLPASYAMFPENVLFKLRPIPKKLFADLSPSSLRLSIYNLEPISSGPYKYSLLVKNSDGFIERYKIERNRFYSNIGKKPYIDKIDLRFYKNNEDLIDAYNLGEIDAFYTENYGLIQEIKPHSRIIDIPTTKYLAVFFNKNSNPILESINIRKALSISVDRDTIVQSVFDSRAITTYSPLTPSFREYDGAIEKDFKYDPLLAKKLIEDDGWQFDEESNSWIKESGEEVATIKIKLSVPNINEMKSIAEIIKKNWDNIGVQTEIELVDPEVIEDKKIKTRDYEALLFGNTLSPNTDLYSFWFSSERFYPGLNLSVYKNENVDEMILELRSLPASSPARTEKIYEIQEVIANDVPAVFLVSPYSFYVARDNIPGIFIDKVSISSDRFNRINEWFVKTRRTLSSSK